MVPTAPCPHWPGPLRCPSSSSARTPHGCSCSEPGGWTRSTARFSARSAPCWSGARVVRSSSLPPHRPPRARSRSWSVSTVRPRACAPWISLSRRRRHGMRRGRLLAWTRTDGRESGHTAAQRAQAALSASLAGYAGTYPQVRVHQIVAAGDPAERILDESAGAWLIVVGSRGRGGFALGSACRAVLDEATVPVLVARPRPGGRRHSRSSER